MRPVRAVAVLLLAVGSAAIHVRANAQGDDWSAVERAMGRGGAPQAGGVERFSFPRADMAVTVDGVRLRPALALGSWLAFRRTANGGAMAMGDLVLADSELAPVLARLQQGGVTPTAVHNHLARETPRVTYVHVDAAGDPVRIAETVRAALALTGTPAASPPSASPPPLELDTAAITRALGHGGRANGGVWQVSVPRAAPVRLHGEEVPPAMGVATALNFQPTGGGRAVATGDFVMTADEVPQVAAALNASHIQLTALHSHMVGEEPRLWFAHFWANGDAAAIARGLGDALAKMAVR
jgi:hypothetical protein